MRKLFIDKPGGIAVGDVITIGGADHKHIAYSLRMRKGDELTVCSSGSEYTAVITDIGRTETHARVAGAARTTAEPDITLDLFFGVLKGDRNDFIVQKCTELGVKSFHPFVSEYAAADGSAVKLERLSRIALEAAKQSGRGEVPLVHSPAAFDEIVGALGEYEKVVFPYEQARERTLKDAISGINAKRIAVVIGPEGGFSAREAETISRISGGSVTLGERVLRAETACIAVCAAVMYEADQWRRK